ncbi:hypothetical protein BaRGS_00012823 [Batillaria attramentaria]|uniref:Uncharacterized protein n=1 Tax=Batillaria attramentaria TaxID=370345 RepID=A0ABD0L8X5_9CAEN
MSLSTSIASSRGGGPRKHTGSINNPICKGPQGSSSGRKQHSSNSEEEIAQRLAQDADLFLENLQVSGLFLPQLGAATVAFCHSAQPFVFLLGLTRPSVCQQNHNSNACSFMLVLTISGRVLQP